MCAKLAALVLVVVPSPKSQKMFVIVPVELLLKFTVSGQKPLVGLPLKQATGTKAPLPLARLVELPPLLVKTTSLLKLPSTVGLKRTNTRLLWPPPTENELAPAIPNGEATATLPVNTNCPGLNI